MAQIEGGDLRPGDRLPTEAQLAAEHGVSRSVVREAVHLVRSRGLVIARQGSGVYVAPEARHKPLEFDPTVLESMGAVVQVMELRRVLEGEIAALAAERATRAQVTAMRRALRAIDAATDAGRDGVAEDLAFHRSIGECTGNAQFSRMLGFLEQYLREAMRVTKGNESRRTDFMQQVRAEHRAIVDAIAAGDAVAARDAAIAHLLNGEWRLQEGGVIEAPKGGRKRRGDGPPVSVAQPAAKATARKSRATGGKAPSSSKPTTPSAPRSRLKAAA